MSISQTFKNKFLNEYERNRYEMVVGQIQQYDETCNRANVYMFDPKNGEQVLLHNVPVEMSGLGVVSSGPFSGDQVYISFVNGSILHPKIVGRADETFGYYSRTLTEHSKSGVYLSDSISSSTGTTPSSSSSSAYNSWTDSGSSSVGNYLGYTGDSTTGTAQQASNSAYYQKAETGLTHPLNRSTVKIRDNGIIDIFVGTNYGMRINPSDGSIALISDSQTQHASTLSQCIDGSMSVQVGGSYTNSSSSFNITSSSGKFSISDMNMTGSSANLSFSSIKETVDSKTLNAKTYIGSHTSYKLNADSYTGSHNSYNLTSRSYSGNHDTYKLTASNYNGEHTTYTLNATDYKGKHGSYELNATSNYSIQSAKCEISSRGKVDINTQASLNLKGISTTIEGQQISVESIATFMKATDFNVEGNAVTLKSNQKVSLQGNKIDLSSSGELNLGGKVKATGDSFNVNSTNVEIGNSSCGVVLKGGTIEFNGAEFGGDFDEQVKEEVEKFFDENFEDKVQEFFDKNIAKEIKSFFDTNFRTYFNSYHNNADHSKWMGS